MFFSILSVCIGASCGALLRWFLGNQFNSLFPTLPPGTLIANLVGGYLIGLAITFFGQQTSLPPEWRLLIITGFLGALTTFSTFSAEVITLFQEGRILWACGAIAIHVIGCLVMTLLGIATMFWLRSI
ncbi:fluoride efflux transporter CrcB [Marinomonas spartinae]|uniref:fluoride efflux transporter CrcB n=1 Tax=Marinomonas spartinae TaxID=1792290 RepID=UPI0018F21B16|nr:fluoride efflux transporter CrcB [Marinomonas spartinae]MBJ7554824.1 fluoride efflux transporter CrcB [Marinomonas spartinae]